LATLFLQAITGAHTLTCLLSRNRSRRNRDAPIFHPNDEDLSPGTRVGMSAEPTGACCMALFYANFSFQVLRQGRFEARGAVLLGVDFGAGEDQIFGGADGEREVGV